MKSNFDLCIYQKEVQIGEMETQEVKKIHQKQLRMVQLSIEQSVLQIFKGSSLTYASHLFSQKFCGNDLILKIPCVSCLLPFDKLISLMMLSFLGELIL